MIIGTSCLEGLAVPGEMLKLEYLLESTGAIVNGRIQQGVYRILRHWQRSLGMMTRSKSSLRLYNLAFVCAFASIGSILVAFMMSPLIFSLPDMNNDCAFAFPETSFPKFSSDKDNVTFAFLPAGASPLATSPFSFRSICQLSVAPELFFNVKAKMALPFLMASARSASLDWSESLIASKAADEGKASLFRDMMEADDVHLLRAICGIRGQGGC